MGFTITALLFGLLIQTALSFVPQSIYEGSLRFLSAETGKGFGAPVATPTKKAEVSPHDSRASTDDVSNLPVLEVKRKLLDLLPRMTGQKEEFALVESYVNALEAQFSPPQTLDFLNLAVSGEWQLLFSTTLRGGPRLNFRIKEMFQKVEPNKLQGAVTNVAHWDLAQEGGEATNIFDCSGTFSAVCEYEINQGARMLMELKDHKVELSQGSTVPRDVQGLVGLIHRLMPTELFDPNEHAMDTTWLDGDLRIVRMTGPLHEGVRDIFIRRGSMEISPVAAAD